jgi:hypothetical protein
MASTLRSFWEHGSASARRGYVVGGTLIGSGLVHLAILALGGGSWEGPVSLRKAATFGLSFGLTLITIVWVTSWVRLGGRSRSVLLSVFTVACALETALVSMQAWRGVPSHYNLETPFDATVARTLAAGGLALIVVILTLTIAAFRADTKIPMSLRIAVRVGFVTLSASLIVGALMIAKGMRLVLAGEAARAYATGGSLKPTHAIAMHAVLVLPALAWLLSFADWTEERRVRVVSLGSAGYLAIGLVVSLQNLAGLSPWDGTLATLLLAAGLLALLTAGSLAVHGAASRFTPGVTIIS